MTRGLRKSLISAFAALNVGTVVYIHAPERLTDRYERNLYAELPSHPQLAYRLRQAQWLVRRYAHLVGLDNRWLMFTTLHRFNWWYLIKARYADSALVVLSLPRQSPRTFWQRHFFDFREAKFHLNIYSDPAGRVAYARHLCRRFPDHDGARVQSIVIELHHRLILPPAEARRRGQAWSADSHGRVIDLIPCGS